MSAPCVARIFTLVIVYTLSIYVLLLYKRLIHENLPLIYNHSCSRSSLLGSSNLFMFITAPPLLVRNWMAALRIWQPIKVGRNDYKSLHVALDFGLIIEFQGYTICLPFWVVVWYLTNHTVSGRTAHSTLRLPISVPLFWTRGTDGCRCNRSCQL